MIQEKLARRWGKHHSLVARIKNNVDFEQKSKKLDPQGIAWQYNSKAKIFFPVN